MMITLNNRRPARGGFLLTACVVVGISAGVAAPPATVPGAYATAVIGDLQGLMNRAGDFAKKANPNLSGETFRGYLGMMLGDPGLKSVPPGSGLVVAIPKAGKPFALLETAEGKAETIGATLQQRTGAMTKVINDKLLAVSMNQAGLDNATGAMGTAAAALLESGSEKSLVITVDTDQLAKDKGAQFQAALKRLPEKAAASGDPNSSGTAKMLAFVGNMISSVAKRTDVATLKIDVSGDGIVFEKELFPIGGINLGAPEGPTGQELRKSLPDADNALVSFEYYLDTQSGIKAFQPLLMETVKASGVSAADGAEIARLFDMAAQSYGDGMAGWIAPTNDSTRGAYLFSVVDPAKALQTIGMEIESMTTGSLSHFYSAVGLKSSATLHRNFKTIDGQPVHQFSASMQAVNGMPKTMGNIWNFRNSLLAFLDGKLLMTMGDVIMESALAKVKAGTDVGGAELKSRTELPQGGFFYADYHPGEMANAMGDTDSQIAPFFDALKGSTIYEAAYVDKESFKFMLKVPSDIVAKAAEIVKQAAQKRAQLMDKDQISTATTPEGVSTTSSLENPSM